MTSDVLIERKAGWGVVTLNRPTALNALTLGMIRAIAAALKSWLADPDVEAILLRAAPGRAFCAGGDIKMAAEGGLAFKRGKAAHDPALYFAEEYLLDRVLYDSGKPIVAMLDGIVMGGGFGLAGPCRYRVVTENTRFAMPEVGIGFFPDVGSAYFLRDCPGGVGTYLALTGNAIGPADMIAAGLATHHVPAAQLQECAVALMNASPDDIAAVLEKFSSRPAESALTTHRNTIDHCFKFDTVREILQALENETSPFASETREIILTRSPTSIMVTLAHLRATAGLDFASVLTRDFALAQHFLADEDFYEGVRAAVIDKDKAPRWQPASFDLVDEARLARYAGPAPLALDDFSIEPSLRA